MLRLYDSDKSLLNLRGYIVTFFVVYVVLLILNPISDHWFQRIFNILRSYGIPYISFALLTHLSLPSILGTFNVGDISGKTMLFLSLGIAALIYVLHFFNPLYYYVDSPARAQQTAHEMYYEHTKNYNPATMFQDQVLGKQPPDRGGATMDVEVDNQFFGSINGRKVMLS